jgi:hypothetical protein
MVKRTRIAKTLAQHCPPQCSLQGWIAVQLGVLFLSTSALLTGVALLLALTVWRPKRHQSPLSSLEARLLLALSLLMLIGTAVSAKAGLQAWVGLANWFPFFWFFLAVRPYLATGAARSRLALWFCAATVPVVALGVLQVSFGWEQELNTLGGLIRWPMQEASTGTSLFDNPNQTATWLAMTMPFLAHRLLFNQQTLVSRCIAAVLSIGATGALLLSASRNAISTLLLSWWLSSGKRLRLIALAMCLGYGALLLLRLSQPHLDQPLLQWLVPDALLRKIGDMGGGTSATLNYGRRVTLYAHGLTWLREFPWFGLGEQGFAALYNGKLINQFGGEPPRGLIMHSHSLPLEFALSHGLPALVVLAVVIGISASRSARLWGSGELSAADRSWCVAAVVLIWLHIWDVAFFDSRINMAGWLVFAALTQMARRSADPTDQRRQA